MKQTIQASERRNQPAKASFLQVSAVRWPRFFCVVALLTCTLLEASTVLPQRPVLRRARRHTLAGNFVLLSNDARLHALALPKQIAFIADHDLSAPPFGTLNNPEQFHRWVNGFDYTATDGVLLSLDVLLGAPSPANSPGPPAPLAFLKAARVQRPQLPVYAFVSVERAATALELVETGLLDFLLINADSGAASSTHAELFDQITQRRLQGRVAFHPSAETAALLLQARLLNRRFGFAPKILPIFSSQPPPAQQQEIRTQLAALDGIELPNNEARQADLLFFVHVAETAPTNISMLANTLGKALDDGHRCALLDLSNNQAAQESLLNQLRQRKLLDRLASYAAATAAPPAESKAITRALTQASAWIISLKFLRDDVERLRRTERAQVGFQLSSYLRDWAYPFNIRPQVETFLREQLKQKPEQLLDSEKATEEVESFALNELKPFAERLFNEQFRRNIHAVLLDTGERAEFEIALLQRLLTRLTPHVLAEPEIRAFVHLAHLGNFLPQPAAPLAFWDFTNTRGLDQRLIDRFDAVDWQVFKTEAETVEVSVKLNQNQQTNPANQESYSIRNRRGGQTRRIEISAATAQGAFYAFGKLAQLGADGQLVQDFNLTETPSFTQRGVVERFSDLAWSHRERVETLRFMGRVRLNRYIYASQFDPLRRERWREPYPNRELEQFRELVQTAQENFVTLAYALHPGAALRYANEEDFTALTAKLKTLASIGIYEFVLGFDDAPLQFTHEADRARFPTLAAAQSSFLRRVDEWQKTNCPACHFAVVPANQLDPAARQAYLQELGTKLPAQMALVWLGSESFLPEYTLAQVQEWARVTGRRPLVWSTFPTNAQAGGRLFLGAKRNAAPSLPQAGAGFFANPLGQVYAARLPLTTVAHYAWESRSYNPAQAWESALNLLYDERSRAGVRLWAHAYGAGTSTGNQPNGQHANAQPTHLFEPLFKPNAPEINVPQLEEQLNILQTALSVIGSTRERGLLRGELAPFLVRAHAALERVKKDPSYERQGNGSYRLRTPQSSN